MSMYDKSNLPSSPKNRVPFLGGTVPSMRASYDMDDDDMDDTVDDIQFENDEPGEDFDDDFDEDFEDEFDEDYEDMDKIDDDTDEEEEVVEEEETLPAEEEFGEMDPQTTFLPEGASLGIADMVTEDEIEEDDGEGVFEDFEEEDEEFDDYED